MASWQIVEYKHAWKGKEKSSVAPCFLMELNGLVICVVAFRQM